MLKEEQVAELLRRCEAIAGRDLKQVRGNLRKALTRAEAVFELLVTEAAAQLGQVEYEPLGGGPDIRLELPSGRWVSIEVTYLHPRFDDEERRSAMVARWMHDAATALAPNPPEIRCQFYGDNNHPAGPKRTLPQEQDRRRFLASAEVAQFLDSVATRPTETHQQRLKNYSVILTASPRAPGSHGFLSWGGSVQEAPKVAKEHAVFRALRAKLHQHKVDEPHLVCIGSDVSSALTSRISSSGFRIEHALGAAVRNSGQLSGVLIVKFEQATGFLQGHSLAAHCTAYPVESCRHPLTEAEWAHICTFDFNRWKYSFALDRREVAPQNRQRHVPGSLALASSSGGVVKLTIPAFVLADVLAGRKELLDDYGDTEEQFGRSVMKCLEEGWSIVGCTYQAGDIERATAPSVVLELAPPHDPVFWSRG